MKRIIAFLMLLATAAGATAHGRRHTMLKLRLSDDSPIAVNIDGRYISRETSSLTLDGLRPGWHRVEVYSLAHARVRPFRIYTGSIRLQSGTVNVAVVDVRDRVFSMRTRPMDAADEQARSRNAEADRDRSDSGRRPTDDAELSTSDDIYAGRERGGDNTQEGYGSFPFGRGNSGPDNAASTLSQQEMEALRNKVAGRASDTEREKLLKSELADERVTTAQVRSMLSWLAFESTRLEMAKWLHSRIADPEHYGELEDVFDFEASRDEFNKAISK